MGGGLFEDGMSPRPHASLVDFGDHQESCNVVLWNFTGRRGFHGTRDIWIKTRKKQEVS